MEDGIPDKARRRNSYCRYIDGFYNSIRRHSSLDYLSSVQANGRLVAKCLSTFPKQVQFQSEARYARMLMFRDSLN